MSYSYVDDTLFGNSSKTKKPNQYGSSYKPSAAGVVIAESTLENIRRHAAPQDKGIEKRDLSNSTKFEKSLSCKARTTTWGNTLASQQRDRLERVRAEREQKEKEIADLAAAYEQRNKEKRALACKNCEEQLYKEQEHQKLMATAYKAVTAAKFKIIAEKEKEEKIAAEKLEGQNAKKELHRLIEEKNQNDKLKQENASKEAKKLALQYDEEFRLKREEEERLKQEKEKELQDSKEMIRRIKEQEQKEAEAENIRKQKYRKLLNSSIDEQTRLKQAEKNRIKALDKLQELTDQHKEEMNMLKVNLQKKAREEQEKRKENIFNICAVEVERANIENEKMLEACCLAELETARKEKIEKERQERLQKQKEETIALVAIQNAEKAAARSAERTADMIYGRRLIDEVEKAEQAEKEKERQKILNEREFYARVNADIQERARINAEIKKAQDEADKADALQNQRDIQRAIDDVEKMISEEKDPAIKRAYGQVLKKLHDRTRKISWMDVN